MRRGAAGCAALALAILLAAAPAALARARWDTRLLALVPSPGFPAMAYVAPNGRIYEGTYDNPAGDAIRSRVFEYEGDGTLLRSWTIAGQDLSQPHGVQVATSDAQGRLILLDKSPPRALRLDRRTGAQSPYAGFPAGSIRAPARSRPSPAFPRGRSRITPPGAPTAASTSPTTASRSSGAFRRAAGRPSSG